MSESIIGVIFDYTYNGQLVPEVLKKPSIMTPAISSMFMVRTGFRYKQQIALVNPISKIVKAYSSCGRTFTDGVDITNTTLELSQLEVNMQWCKDDFEDTIGNILSELWMNDGVEEFNPEGTEIETVINELIEDGIRRDNFRLVSFGDTNDADADWNQIDGLWTRLLAADGSGASYCVQAPVTDLGTGSLSSGQALSALKDIYENSRIILKQLPPNMKYIAVTGSVFENLLASYEANVNGTEKQFTYLLRGPEDTNGMPTLTYRGIQVMPVYAWDSDLEDTTNPLYGNQKHLILYTTRNNHAVGMHIPEEKPALNAWYERKDRKYYVEGFQRLGYNYIHCDLQTIGY